MPVEDRLAVVRGFGLSGQSRGHVVAWMGVAALSAAVAVWVIDRRPAPAPQAAYAQTAAPAPLGARGIYMCPAQLGPTTFGLYMIDVDAGTLWCYEYTPNQLRLVAARSWIFDRYLEEYNVAGLRPADVAKLVQQQRSQRSRLEELGGDASGESTGGPR